MAVLWELDRKRFREEASYQEALLVWARANDLPVDYISLDESIGWGVPVWITQDEGGRMTCHAWLIVPPEGWAETEDGELPPSQFCPHHCCGQQHTIKTQGLFPVDSLLSA